MPSAKPFGYDEIEGLADGFVWGKAKYPLCRSIPENNLAVRSGGNNRISGCLDESFHIHCFAH